MSHESVSQPDVEVLMEDGTWQDAVAEVEGAGDSEQCGGEGWRFVKQVAPNTLDWWAAPGEWRHKRLTGR